jgi:hypothetical protein
VPRTGTDLAPAVVITVVTGRVSVLSIDQALLGGTRYRHSPLEVVRQGNATISVTIALGTAVAVDRIPVVAL